MNLEIRQEPQDNPAIPSWYLYDLDTQGISEDFEEWQYTREDAQEYLDMALRCDDPPFDDMEDLVEDAIDNLCKFVQDRLGIDRGDFAGIYWSSDVPRDVIASYINGERGMK